MAGGSWPQTEILNQFGENLKKARTAKELSLRALADTADMDFGNIKRQSKPRSKMDYDKPGHYEMVAQLEKTELDPGDTLRIDLYFSGYGQIRGSKEFFFDSI